MYSSAGHGRSALPLAAVPSDHSLAYSPVSALLTNASRISSLTSHAREP